MYLHKNKKGFTLIELMVVVAIIAILALLGLRLYSTQQEKAKISMAKANAGTVQVAIQTHLVDGTLTEAQAIVLPDLSVLQNPWTSQTGAGAVHTTAAKGVVVVDEITSGVEFKITPCNGNGDLISDYVLTAQK
jgi:type IV pilus assembly protein PilA